MLEEKLADLAHGLHERVAHQHRDVGAGEALRLLAEDAQVVVGQRVFGIAERQLEQVEARRFLRQGDVNALLETTPDGCVQHPRDVGGGQHQNTLVVLLSKKNTYTNRKWYCYVLLEVVSSFNWTPLGADRASSTKPLLFQSFPLFFFP